MFYKSSFNGVISEIPGISVDNFENSALRASRAYFLSHCHTDHTQGLNTSEFFQSIQSTKATIYMSEPTKAIMEDSLGDNFQYIKPYVEGLELGDKLITLPATSNLTELIVNVTVIPAAHCFGSVMFLFRTTSKTILFTGDFRLDANDVTKIRSLHDAERIPLPIDVMYLDTTFIDEKFSYFPRRSESIGNVLKEIKEWCQKSDTNLVSLHTSAKYGYEYVFNEIYEKLNMKIFVNNERWQFYRSVQHLVPGVTNDQHEAKIHICQNRSERAKEHCLCGYDVDGSRTGQYLYIHFSALKWSDTNAETPTFTKTENRIDVCFATHCSRSEIISFVSYFDPKTVIGFPNEYKPSGNSLTDVKVKVSSPKKMKVFDENVVRDTKVDVNILRELFA